MQVLKKQKRAVAFFVFRPLLRQSGFFVFVEEVVLKMGAKIRKKEVRSRR